MGKKKGDLAHGMRVCLSQSTDSATTAIRQGAEGKRTEAKRWEDVHLRGNLLKFSSDNCNIFNMNKKAASLTKVKLE